MTASKKASDDFLAALQGAVRKEERNKSAAAVKRKAQEKLYARTLKPIVEALAALPTRNGKKFTCEVSFISPAWPQIEIMIVHHADDGKKPLESSHWKKICFSASNYISPESYFLYDIRATSNMLTNSYTQVKDFAAAPALLGKWVATVAPECLNDLTEALRNPASHPSPKAQRIKVLKPLQFKKHS